MQPLDVPAVDRRMYYHGTLMRHRTEGIVEVTFNTDSPHYRKLGGEWKRAALKDLSIYWLAPGAYNVENTAVYIGRKGVRSTKKSANRNSYYYAWKRQMGEGRNVPAMSILHGISVSPQPYPNIEEAEEMLKKGYSAIAVSPEFILSRGSKYMTVVFGGVVVGSLIEGKFKPRTSHPRNEYIKSMLEAL